jgi:hypothetical protein
VPDRLDPRKRKASINFEAKFYVRTSIVNEGEGWFVRVRVESPDGQSMEDDIMVGPWKDEAEANREGQKVAQLVRKVRSERKAP